jgi:hypothetical protein
MDCSILDLAPKANCEWSSVHTPHVRGRAMGARWAAHVGRRTHWRACKPPRHHNVTKRRRQSSQIINNTYLQHCNGGECTKRHRHIPLISEGGGPRGPGPRMSGGGPRICSTQHSPPTFTLILFTISHYHHAEYDRVRTETDGSLSFRSKKSNLCCILLAFAAFPLSLLNK